MKSLPNFLLVKGTCLTSNTPHEFVYVIFFSSIEHCISRIFNLLKTFGFVKNDLMLWSVNCFVNIFSFSQHGSMGFSRSSFKSSIPADIWLNPRSSKSFPLISRTFKVGQRCASNWQWLLFKCNEILSDVKTGMYPSVLIVCKRVLLLLTSCSPIIVMCLSFFIGACSYKWSNEDEYPANDNLVKLGMHNWILFKSSCWIIPQSR